MKQTFQPISLKKINRTKKLTLTAVFIAIGIILPIFFHFMGLLGKIFLPMHIPIFLCGILCGPVYGIFCALITVNASSVLTGMPPFYPSAIAMSGELSLYGYLSGSLYKKTGVFPALIISMTAGRVLSGLLTAILLGLSGKSYSTAAFITAAFITSFPGIIIQLTTIPLIIEAFKKQEL